MKPRFYIFIAVMLPNLVFGEEPGKSPGHVTLKAGDLTAVVGDNSAHGAHRGGYNGVWSLTHAGGKRSVFVPAVSGLNLEHIVTGEHLEDAKTFFEPSCADASSADQRK